MEQLTEIDLTGVSPLDSAGTNITITAVPKDRTGDGIKDGDGLVNIGRIDATGRNVGNVTIKGDLGEIDCGAGSSDPAFPALKTLTVRSMGALAGATQGNIGFLQQSSINGHFNSLVVSGDLVNAYIRVGNPANDADLLSVKIGGSVHGSKLENDGAIYAAGDPGPVTVKGDVIGGAWTFKPRLRRAGHTVKSMTIGGSSHRGWRPDVSGSPLRREVSRRVRHGAGEDRPRSGRRRRHFLGLIIRFAKLGTVTLGGSVFGGSGSSSGVIFGTTGIGAVKIGRDLVGGSADDTGAVVLSGLRDCLPASPSAGRSSATPGSAPASSAPATRAWRAATRT